MSLSVVGGLSEAIKCVSFKYMFGTTCSQKGILLIGESRPFELFGCSPLTTRYKAVNLPYSLIGTLQQPNLSLTFFSNDVNEEAF